MNGTAERVIDTREFPWWKFCGVKGEHSCAMLPWRFRGYTYATNGFVVVRCWGAWAGQPGSKHAVNSVKNFAVAIESAEAMAAEFQPLGPVELIEYSEYLDGCAGCLDRGFVGEDLEWGCEECQGSGHVPGNRWAAKLGEQFFHGYYLRAIKELPGVEWRPTDPDPRMDRPIHFRWRAEPLIPLIPAGEGLLMPLAYER
jgi:hypothetical protein